VYKYFKEGRKKKRLQACRGGPAGLTQKSSSHDGRKIFVKSPDPEKGEKAKLGTLPPLLLPERRSPKYPMGGEKGEWGETALSFQKEKR